jgi:O-antigen/teichoic acid export membrane protein
LYGRSIRLSPFLYDLVTTAGTSVVTVVALVLLARILADRLSPDGFGAVMLARRVISALDPLSTLAMVIAVTRFAALENRRGANSVLLAGALLALAAGSVFVCVAMIGAVPLASALFGAARYAPLMQAAGVNILAYSAFIVLYAWYRGTDRMGLANLWQLWAVAVGPVCVAWFVARPGSEAAFIAGVAGVLATAALPLAWELRRARRTASFVDIPMLRRLVSYAAPRVPGAVAFGVLLATGPLIAPHVASLAAVGYLATGHALLRLVEATTEAFGRVALGKVAQLYAAGEHRLLTERIGDVTAVTVHVGMFAACQLWVWTPVIVGSWLGDEYLPGVPAVRLIVIGVLPYLLFVTLRSVLDAVEQRPVNARNTYAALAVTVAGSLALGAAYEAEGLAFASTLGLTVLGVRTASAVWHHYQFGWRPIMVPQALVLNALLLAAAAALRSSAPASAVSPLLLAGASTLTLGVAYLAALRLLGARWMDEIGRRIEFGSSV